MTGYGSSDFGGFGNDTATPVDVVMLVVFIATVVYVIVNKDWVVLLILVPLFIGGVIRAASVMVSRIRDS